MNPASIYAKKGYTFLFIAAVYLLIYFQTFTADFAYMDEVYQIWNNQHNSNLMIFLTQGRWLSGLLYNKASQSISTIEELKYLRLFSLFGWILTTCLWHAVFTRWANVLKINDATRWLSTLFIICSASTAITIGWMSCMQIFLAVGTALLAGHVLFISLYKYKGQKWHFTPALFLSLLLSVVSLFLYQTAYGAFFLPFFFYFIKMDKVKVDRLLLTGFAVYLLSYILYYFLFQLTLQAYNTAASTRTGINLDILGKISFFFSGPVPQAFSLNWLYSSSSLICQILYISMFVAWLASVFIGKKRPSVSHKLLHIAGVLFLLAIIYLPLMISKENFSSYRTLIAVNLAVFVLVVEAVDSFLKTARKKRTAFFLMATYILFTGFYNYNIQYINPLRKEYSALQTYIQQYYTADKLTVHFIRPDRKLFKSLYGRSVIKDEYGIPSTAHEWVPEAFVRQLILELSGSRAAANRVTVLQYENRDQYAQSNAGAIDKSLLLDVNEIVSNAQP